RDLKRAGRALALWSAAQIVLIAAYGAWLLPTDRVTAYGELSAEQSVGLLDMLTRTVASFVLGDTVPDAYQHALAPIVTIALIACLIVWARQDRARAIFIALYIAVPLVGVYLTSLGRPLFSERYITGILPAYFLLIAFGLTTLWKLQNRWRAIAVALAAIFLIASAAYALANYYFNPAYAKAPDWRGVWQVIAQERRAGDIVVQNFTDDAMSYYRNRFLLATVPQIQPGCNNAIDYLPVITLPKDFFATAEDQKRLAQLNADCQRIWFIPAAPDWWDPARAVEKYLTRHDDLILDRTISTLQLQLYQTPREFETQLTRIDARVDNAQLVGYRAEGFARGEKISIAAGKILRVVLYWRAANQIEKDYTIFAHLVDANDQIAAQLDHAPVPGDYATSVWRSDEWIVDAFDLRVDAPPGMYMLAVGLYDPATLERAPARDPNDARFANDRVTLFQITISP
ncbi:MAG: hypothetical protein HY257_04470, partial [Chloroflexi bacterium]|nr:hypothetical protein [Chloroflexota bacterium]